MGDIGMAQDLVKMKDQVYKDPRPAEHFDRFHARTRSREPDAVYEAVRILTSLFCMIAYRARAYGSENVPGSGPVIIAPNHFSFMDHFLTGMGTRRRVRFMAKSQLFSGPMQWVYTHGGVFPVRRGHHDEEAFITAETILARGGPIVMYCEGGRSRTGELSERAKPGIGRLALESGAPVVPVAIHGSQGARNWKRAQFPKVTVVYGDPMAFEKVADPPREEQQHAADEIFAAIKELYAEVAGAGRAGIARRARERHRAAPA
jgi:1-acyl-sn-glycerol-3-phosphate acyltransferase